MPLVHHCSRFNNGGRLQLGKLSLVLCWGIKRYRWTAQHRWVSSIKLISRLQHERCSCLGSPWSQRTNTYRYGLRNRCWLLAFLFEVLQMCCRALMNDPKKVFIQDVHYLGERGSPKCNSSIIWMLSNLGPIRVVADLWNWLQCIFNGCVYSADRQPLIQEIGR